MGKRRRYRYILSGIVKPKDKISNFRLISKNTSPKEEITMKNKKLLKYFTEQILPILDEIEFSDTEYSLATDVDL